MDRYPSINSERFYSFVTREWEEYKIPPEKENISMKELCLRSSFEKQKQQEFVTQFLSPKTPYNRLLLYHGLGSGKCIHPSTVVKVFTHHFEEVHTSIENIHNMYSRKNIDGEAIEIFDGEGYWSSLNQNLYVLSYDPETTCFFHGRVKNLYRQPVKEKLIRVELEGGTNIMITRIHKLYDYDNKKWTNDLKIGMRVCAHSKGFRCPKKIVKLTPIYFEGDVYDLEVEDYHNFVAAEVVCHNTCASISVAERWKEKNKILVILSASLEGNYRNELRSECSDIDGVNPYITPSERKKLTTLSPSSIEYKKIIRASNSRINKHYTILSYEKFALESRKSGLSFTGKVVIIDEVQNIVSLEGTRYKELLRRVTITPPKRLILLSATPIFDNPLELPLTVNLLKSPKERFVVRTTKENFLDTYLKMVVDGRVEKMVLNNEENLKNRLRGLISYYRGANPKAYPDVETIKVVCNMSSFQASVYEKSKEEFNEKELFKMKNTFFVASRSASNIVYPNGGIGKEGYASSTPNMYLEKNIERYSCKLKRVLEIVRQVKGPIFIYSNFVEYAGVKQIVSTLKANGFGEYGIDLKGPKIAVFSGKESKEYRNSVVREYNLPANKNGNLIKIVIGSPSIKEGVTLKRTRAVIIFDPYWNDSRMQQIIGRAVRYCSHSDLPESQRNVKVYLMIANNESKGEEEKMIDEYLYFLAFEKKKINDMFNTILKEVAVDCELFKNANQTFNDSYTCFTPNTDFAITEKKERATLAESIKPNFEIRFSVNKTKILNEENTAPLMKYLKATYPPKSTIPVLVAYNQKRESEDMAKKRLRIVRKILKESGVENSLATIIKPMTRSFIRFKPLKKERKMEMAGSGKPKVSGKTKPVPGCPKYRRVDDDGNCPENYPYKAVNPKGYDCCYKKRTKDKAGPNKGKYPQEEAENIQIKNGKVYINGKLCMGYKATELKNIAKEKGLQISGRVTKQKVCDELKKK